jgi:hypothetical protein
MLRDTNIRNPFSDHPPVAIHSAIEGFCINHRGQEDARERLTQTNPAFQKAEILGDQKIFDICGQCGRTRLSGRSQFVQGSDRGEAGFLQGKREFWLTFSASPHLTQIF